MKIISLIVENVLKIKALRIVPKDSVVEIKGDNAAGKSSILDAIVMAFKGDRELPEKPIRNGAKKGVIKLKIDGDEQAGIPPFTITRSITAKGAYISIEPDSFLVGETPRSFLDKLIGKISFDPLSFINNESKKQRQILLELIGVNVDELDRLEKEKFEERAGKKREVVKQKGKVDGLQRWPEIKETEERTINDLAKKLSEAIEHNNSIEERKRKNKSLADTSIYLRDTVIPGIQQDISECEEKIRLAKIKLKEKENELDQNRAKHKEEKESIALMMPIDTSDISESVKNIESTNSRIRDNKKYNEEFVILSNLEAQHSNLDQQLEKIRNSKLELLQNAKMPVEGLSFNDDGLIYNDIPLAQCSDGEKLMISMSISMALNPSIKVLRIKDGSLLGPANMKILRSMVDEAGYQLWIEKVMDRDEYEKSGGMGIFIEEGEMVMDDGKEINEIFGHGTGDNPMGAITTSTKESLPDDDF